MIARPGLFRPAQDEQGGVLQGLVHALEEITRILRRGEERRRVRALIRLSERVERTRGTGGDAA